jgi:transposase
LVDEGKENKEISENLHISMTTISRVRRRYAEGGISFARKERPRPGGKPILDGRKEAVLIAQACSDLPEGRSQWTMQLLADRLVKLEIVDSISDETVRRSLKKAKSNHGSVASGV